jgi:AAA+ ATPase superfamily predicted ATPase
MQFVGRHRQLSRLQEALDQVVASGTGMMLSIRGRRQVGKSRLLTEFVERSGAPYLYHTAIKNGSGAQQLERLREDASAARRPLADAATLFATAPSDWSDAFGRLRLAAREVAIVVLDEIPWAVENDVTLEGRLQVAWDRELERTPILLILVGSDLGMMERLTAHDRPLYGRASEMVVQPFNPAECQAALGSDTTALAAFDAHLATGGYPRLLEDLRRTGSLDKYVERGLSDENSDLLVVAQRSLDAEFAPDAQARRVLTAIGAEPVGHATFTNAAARLGSPDDGRTKTAVTRGLEVLRSKGIVSVDTPFGSAERTKTTRYRVLDPYLSLWMRFVEPHTADIARGRADLAISAYRANWSTWRGVAIEPIVREAIARLGNGHPLLTGVEDVAGWWNRQNNPEVDIVAGRLPNRVAFVGSIKWRARKVFTGVELADLAAARALIPNAATSKLLAVCPAGLAKDVVGDVNLTPDELLAAW